MIMMVSKATVGRQWAFFHLISYGSCNRLQYNKYIQYVNNLLASPQKPLAKKIVNCFACDPWGKRDLCICHSFKMMPPPNKQKRQQTVLSPARKEKQWVPVATPGGPGRSWEQQQTGTQCMTWCSNPIGKPCSLAPHDARFGTSGILESHMNEPVYLYHSLSAKWTCLYLLAIDIDPGELALSQWSRTCR